MNDLIIGGNMSVAEEAKRTIRIENIVASTATGHEIDLASLRLKLDAEYDPKRFPGVVYRIKDPKIAALIFKSGKIVCTGAKSINDVNVGLKKVFKNIHDVGIKITGEPLVTIQNIVASANLGSELNLNAITVGLSLENVEYEPEQFPGLVYRLSEPMVVILLFGSGKLVVTGGKSIKDVEAAVEKIAKELKGLNIL